ncbi:uncharacterized protein EV422DRAFT_564748 [Fimicolochytrium jonesii]|uniref:uncharacterized protein n=1 Tax=Fimicolochytrium jonesii TaxID=1396493 RepID=UPI0022FDD71C|nr:uncharacterized protein EV422DRAFT_564748 [Fimicolochytrium jonesii]KAI8824042.1 hypothetical protein EV422DRAFT_564748 [Fimicolochytrium jonesii]
MSTASLIPNAEDFVNTAPRQPSLTSLSRRQSRAALQPLPSPGAYDSHGTLPREFGGSRGQSLHDVDLYKGDAEAGRLHGDVRGYTLNTAYLGVAFCFIFVAFNVGQSYITVLYPDIGTYVLGVIYLFFALGSLTASSVGDALGPKGAMCVASIAFVAFVASLNTRVEALVLVAAALVGIGSGTLWINQGLWLSRLCGHAGGTLTGYFTGLFFTICNANGVLGNILALILLEVGLSLSTMIWAMLIVVSLGALMLFFAAPMAAVPTSLTTSSAPSSLRENVKAVWRVMRMPKSAVVAPSIWIQGCNLALMFGRLTETLPAGSGQAAVSKCFLCYGFTQCLFSYLNGLIYDRYGQTPLVRSFLLTGLGGYLGLLSILPSEFADPQPIAAFLAVSAALGHVDATLNTMVNLAITNAYTADTTAAAFGCYRIVFCAAMVVMNIFAVKIAVGWVVIGNAMWIAVAGAVYIKFAGMLTAGDGGAAAKAMVDPELGISQKAVPYD